MLRIGFDNDKYLRLQSEKIRERIARFGGKLYLEFGGKLFDDYHASRVLPGFEPDSKVRMLMEMKDEAEIIIVISADDIERSKRRGDLGITYDDDLLRLIDAFKAIGLYVGSVSITHFRGQQAAEQFKKRRCKNSRFYSLSRYVRRMKRAHKQFAVVAKGRADFPACRRRCKTTGAHFN